MFGDDFNDSYESGDTIGNFEEVCYGGALSDDFKRIFLPTVFGIIFVLGIIGNGLVVTIMGCQKKASTTTDKYRLHLSVADLLFVLTLPFWAVDALSGWRFGDVLCVSVHMIFTVNLYSSVLILAFISIDRYLAIVHATNSQRSRKLLTERVIFLGVWLPAVLLTVPDLGFVKVYDTGSKVICERIYPETDNHVWAAVFRFQHIAVGFVIPGIIVLTCYSVIIHRLSQGSKGQLLKRKALKTTVILIFCFFFCWLPYCGGILVDTLITLNVFSPSCDLVKGLDKWIFITEALAYFHCCLNPILYAFLGATFKKSARSALNINSSH